MRDLLLALLLCVSGDHALAAGPTALSLDMLTSQRTEIEQAGDLAEDQKKQGLSRIDETRSLLDEAKRLQNRNEELLQRIDAAPETLSDLRQDRSREELELDPKELAPWTLAQLEAVLIERQERLAEMQKELADREQELGSYQTLARTGGGELADLEKRLSELKARAADAEDGASADRLKTVDQAWYAARKQVLEARIAWTRLQQNNLGLLTELAQVARDVAAARVEALGEHLAQLRQYVQERRRAEVEAETTTAQQEMARAPSAIKGLQEKIAALAKEREELIDKEFRVDQDNERIDRLIEEVKRDHERIQQIVELGGATAQVSRLLQKRRALAPSTKDLTQQAIDYQQMLSDASLRQLERDELLRSRDVEEQVERMLAESDLGEAEREAARASAREAWLRYREGALDLWKLYTRYIGKLSTLEANTRQLLEEARSYRTFIDDNLLWMPSTELVPEDESSLLLTGLGWLVDPEHIAHLGQDAQRALAEEGPAVAAWVLGLALILMLDRRARTRLEEAATATQKVRTDSFHATLKALGNTLVLILPLPWLLVGGGLVLGGMPAAHEYTLVVAVGLQVAGHTLFFLQTLRQVCRANGLARVHLSWHPALCDNLGRQARWLIPLATPLAFFSGAGSAAVPSAFVQLTSVVQTDQAGLLSMGRVSLITTMVLLAVAIHRIWRKKGAVMQAMTDSDERAKWASYHVLWFGPAMLIPIGVALAALSGYYYTAAFLVGKAGETLWFIFSLVLGKDLVLRALYVAQRRLRFEEALRYREEALARRAASSTETAHESEAGELPLEEDKIDYGQLGGQVRQLVRLGYTVAILSGLWWIWKDVVPAFSFLDQVELPITTSKLVDGVSQEVPLTLSDMVAGLLFGGLALFAARNIPALLELTILQRLPLTRASRYAFTTLTQYVVAVIGLVITFNALGLEWSSIQWLVAALSVGLGFGLQEIVANFISGIILLFEQPIRVGDVVTVDNTSGTVSRIRIRATTIVNWERQELVIPNKAFITGQLINWTLSDTVNRLTVTVGVDYGTDTREAMRLMAEAAREHPNVVDDPAPLITFEGFGDNALTLIMRAYLTDVGVRLSTTTELHQAILDKFRAAGISIAFPQRDIHLFTSKPLEMVLRRGPQPQTGAD